MNINRMKLLANQERLISMESYSTRCGVLHHIGEYSLYADGSMKECMFLGEVELTTEYGSLIPQYEFEDNRRKYIYSLSCYKGGSIRRIALNDKTVIPTPIGKKEAELVMFYQSGKLKRLFPLNGRISAYWDENDEYKLAKEDRIELPCGIIKAKVIAYSFYENGVVRDLTFWPKETIKLVTPLGEIRARIGVSFYQDGSIKSLEPSFPVSVQTPIGRIKAFDYNASGISGDQNSLLFTGTGAVQELITSGMKITIQDREGKTLAVFSPVQDLDEDGLEVSFTALKLAFENNKVCFNASSVYDITEHTFIIEAYHRKVPGMCSDCAECGKCSEYSG
jgi:hypothetical protein